MNELKGREIFAVGTWNGVEFTEEDLDEIVSNFERLYDSHKVPLKFGHNDEQPITDGQPAIGWISRLFRKGQKLYADFSNMPRTVFEAIKQKLYRTVSVELLFNVDKDGKKYNHVLDAVALLGADHPAVSSLADLDALLASRTTFSGGHKLVFETVAGTRKKLRYNFDEENDMSDTDVKELIDAAVAPLRDANVELSRKLEDRDAELKALLAERDKAEADAKKQEVKLARDKINQILDDAVRNKTLAPASREIYAKQIGVDDDDRVVSIDVDEIKKVFSVKVIGNGSAGLERDPADVDDGDPEDRLDQLTRENMSQTGENDYRVAFMRVARANPKLHIEYLNSNGVK